MYEVYMKTYQKIFLSAIGQSLLNKAPHNPTNQQQCKIESRERSHLFRQQRNAQQLFECLQISAEKQPRIGVESTVLNEYQKKGNLTSGRSTNLLRRRPTDLGFGADFAASLTPPIGRKEVEEAALVRPHFCILLP